MSTDDTAYCIEGCGEPAVGECLDAMTFDGTPIVELVCYDHAQSESEQR